MSESLVDAVDRLIDCLERDHHNCVMTSPPLREAVEMAYAAYLRERAKRDEMASEFPDLGLRLKP